MAKQHHCPFRHSSKGGCRRVRGRGVCSAHLDYCARHKKTFIKAQYLSTREIYGCPKCPVSKFLFIFTLSNYYKEGYCLRVRKRMVRSEIVLYSCVYINPTSPNWKGFASKRMVGLAIGIMEEGSLEGSSIGTCRRA
jgi:hypothetical protein